MIGPEDRRVVINIHGNYGCFSEKNTKPAMMDNILSYLFFIEYNKNKFKRGRIQTDSNFHSLITVLNIISALF